VINKPNATILIPIPSTTATGTDPISGLPIYGEGTTKKVSAFLEEKKPPTIYSLPGTDNPIAYLEGRIVGSPPVGLKADFFYPITIKLQNESVSRHFYVCETTSGGLGLEVFFGTAIKGFLVN